jgi:molybdopterin-guanine dinucleotide biosynthesis protein A
MPSVTPGLLRSLAEGADGADVSHPQTGPLPGAYRASALPVFERRIAVGDLALHRALEELETRVIKGDPELLRNVNTPADLKGFR